MSLTFSKSTITHAIYYLANFEFSSFFLIMSYQHSKQSSLEITNFDVRIAKDDEISSSLDLLLMYFHETKDSRHCKSQKSNDNLVQENEYLRQKIVYYKESRNVMFAFHNKTMKAFQILQCATQELSKKMILLERRILKY